MFGCESFADCLRPRDVFAFAFIVWSLNRTGLCFRHNSLAVWKSKHKIGVGGGKLCTITSTWIDS